jgi:hypothetical protein
MNTWKAAITMLAMIFGAASAQPQAPAPAMNIVAKHSLPLTLADGKLRGAGADLLLKAAADAQFLIVIESHNDHVTPSVTSALFGALNQRHGFNYLAIEQDPFGMEAASSPPRRGRVDRIAEHARAYPFSYTFATDEEFHLLADAGRISTGKWKPVWGFDQTFGATLPLEELQRLAKTARARAAIARLHEEVKRVESRRDKDGQRDMKAGHFLTAREDELLARIEEIRALMAPAPRSRAAQLIEALRSSAEIYSYYDPNPPLDAAGTPRKLLNNSVRELWMKRSFMRDYRMAEAADRKMPKVVVKAGSYHTVRGLSDTGVFTLGTFLHEFAISNGSTALSIQVLALREWWPTYDKIDQPYRALLPSGAMDRATLVDMRPLRAHLHTGETFGLVDKDLRAFRQLLFGVDFALFMPSKPGGRTLAAVKPRETGDGQAIQKRRK